MLTGPLGRGGSWRPPPNGWPGDKVGEGGRGGGPPHQLGKRGAGVVHTRVHMYVHTGGHAARAHTRVRAHNWGQVCPGPGAR